MANNNQKSSGCGTGLVFIGIAIIVVLVFALGSCSSGGSSSSKSSKCQVCGRTFTNKADVKSIAYTNMCENCYKNYKYSQNLKDELNKYNERYGN